MGFFFDAHFWKTTKSFGLTFYLWHTIIMPRLFILLSIYTGILSVPSFPYILMVTMLTINFEIHTVTIPNPKGCVRIFRSYCYDIAIHVYTGWAATEFIWQNNTRLYD